MSIADSIPPARVSRLALLILVAGGALVSIATQGVLSHFSGGFAVGAGAALVLSRLGLVPGEPDSDAKGNRP
jgi:hypothetical protein